MYISYYDEFPYSTDTRGIYGIKILAPSCRLHVLFTKYRNIFCLSRGNSVNLSKISASP